jgi:hypothetical protein
LPAIQAPADHIHASVLTLLGIFNANPVELPGPQQDQVFALYQRT